MMQSDMDDLRKKERSRRRHFIALTACLAMHAVQSPAWAGSTGPSILILGDSLSAEYGLRRGSGWVALLTQKLSASGRPTQVFNASISGDTSSGGRARLPALLHQHQPKLVVIELGANDALRGLALEQTQANLQAMSRAAKTAGARVVLVGMQLPPNYGKSYSQRFAQLFEQVAKSEGVGLVPFMLKGVADLADSTRLFQADGIHPLEAAHPIILTNIWPELKKALP
jgi:acyl-CoA thioesterase-1